MVIRLRVSLISLLNGIFLHFRGEALPKATLFYTHDGGGVSAARSLVIRDFVESLHQFELIKFFL